MASILDLFGIWRESPKLAEAIQKVKAACAVEAAAKEFRALKKRRKRKAGGNDPKFASARITKEIQQFADRKGISADALQKRIFAPYSLKKKAEQYQRDKDKQ